MRSKGGSSKGSVLGCMNGLSTIAEILAVFCPGPSPGTRAEAEKVAARTPKHTSLMVSPQICPAEPPWLGRGQGAMVSFAPLRCAPVWLRFFLARRGARAFPFHTGPYMSITQDQVVTLHYTLR